MKIIEERQFDYIPDKVYKSLSKLDRNNLRDYRRSYGHYKTNDEKILSLEKELKERKEKKKGYVKKLTRFNYDLDHLRNDYHFSWSVTKLKNKNDYYNFSISRKGHPTKSGSLGSTKLMKQQLLNCLFYKNDTDKKKQIEKDWIDFLKIEMGINLKKGNSKVRMLVLDCILKDTTLKKIPLNRKNLFPLTKKDYPKIN